MERAGEAAVGDDDPAAGSVLLDEIEQAGLFFATGEPGRYVPAPAVSAAVDIRVTGLIARARVTQRFANPSADWVEGIYVFPLPETAAVDTLRLVVGDRVIEGEIREREAAKKAYEEAKSAGVKASLVEQRRANVFTTAVANLGPGEEVEVTVEYQQTVDFDGGEFHLRFPTVVAPRFDPGDLTPAGRGGDGGVGRRRRRRRRRRRWRSRRRPAPSALRASAADGGRGRRLGGGPPARPAGGGGGGPGGRGGGAGGPPAADQPGPAHRRPRRRDAARHPRLPLPRLPRRAAGRAALPGDPDRRNRRGGGRRPRRRAGVGAGGGRRA